MMSPMHVTRPWSQSDFIVLDLEGTGSQHKEKQEIVEIAAIPINGGRIVEPFLYKLINPGIEIPPVVSKIHGLKNADLLNEPGFDGVKDEIFGFLHQKILVGHHVHVDDGVLKLKMPDYRPLSILDTRKISKYFWAHEAKHGLDDLIERFAIQDMLTNLPIRRGRHSAFYDAYATAILFLKMLEEKVSKDSSLQQIMDICAVKPGPGSAAQPLLF